MNNDKRGWILWGIFLITPLIAFAPQSQLKRDGLIFSEVYLNANEPDKSWLEIYNPTAKPLILEKFRFYNVRTTNILPEEIQKKGGVEILPGECIILCANESKFNYSIMAKIKVIQISQMVNFGKGGFFSLKTKDMGEDGVDIFRYGNPAITEKLKSQIGDFVVPFSRNSNSYTRVENKNPKKRFLPNFIKTEPTLGHHLEKEGQNG